MTARWTTQQDPLTRRPVHTARARSGAAVWVAPLPGFARIHASLTARYGSLDTALPDGTGLPEGTAHFLEHRMFQTPDGDVFDHYADRGAAANAYTSFDHTSYMFDCTRRFEENLTTLLTTLSSLHTDAAGVDHEREIIGQEIAMYADDPAWLGYFALLGAMYRRHPIRIDIAGTPETIAQVDAALLERAHAAFYHPRNFILVVCGDVDRDRVLALADEHLPVRRRGRRHRRSVVPEPLGVCQRKVHARLPIARSHVLLGLKEPAPGGGLRRLRHHVETTMALDILCGDGGRIQRRFYAEGLIDDSFAAGCESDRDYAFALVSADVEDVEAWRRRLIRAFERARSEGFTDREVERCRRKLLGRHLRTFNAPDELAYQVLGVALDGSPFGAGVDVIRTATAARLSRRLDALVGAPRAWSVLDPV